MSNPLTLLIPTYNEAANIPMLYERLVKVLAGVTEYELLFIDDGSTDGTAELLKEISEKDKKVSFIRFSRNFGHQAALKAGYDYARGEAVICMDADMQHPPELIPEMIEKWQQGYDVVYTIREDKKNMPFIKRVTSKIFYWFINKLSDTSINRGAADFRLLDRKVVDALRRMPETNLFFRGMIPWLGFKQIGIPYRANEREAGETKFSFGKMLNLALSGVTGFSIRPLRLSLFAGLTIALLAAIYGFYAIVMALFTDKTITGWTSVIVSVLFLSGIQLIVLGIMGEYIGKLFMEIKRRPHYVIEENSQQLSVNNLTKN